MGRAMSIGFVWGLGIEVEAIMTGFWEAQPPNLGPRQSRMPFIRSELRFTLLINVALLYI